MLSEMTVSRNSLQKSHCITFLCLLQSYYRAAILRDCCVLLQTWKHTPKSALPSGICTGFSAPRLQEDRKNIIPFSPKVDSFTFKWCFSPKLISATSNHFTPALLASPPFQLTAPRKPLFPGIKNTHGTHGHLCKHLTQNHSRTPDFHPCPEMEPVSHQLPQGYITPHVSPLVLKLCVKNPKEKPSRKITEGQEITSNLSISFSFLEQGIYKTPPSMQACDGRELSRSVFLFCSLFSIHHAIKMQEVKIPTAATLH